MTSLGHEKRVELGKLQKEQRYKKMQRTWNLINPLLEITKVEVLKAFNKFPSVKRIVFNRNGTIQLEFRAYEERK